MPSIAVLGGLTLAFVGIGHLIFFIHHISMSIQASSIVAAAAAETIIAVDCLFPDDLEGETDEGMDASSLASDGRIWTAIAAQRTGYLQSIDTDALLEWARKRGSFLRMERAIGDFVIEGVNDTTTAIICIDYLGAIFVRLAGRSIGSPHRMDDGIARVIARGPSFAGLLAEGFDEIRQHAQGNVAILKRLLGALEVIVSRTSNAQRRQVLRQQAQLIAAAADRTIKMPHDIAEVIATSTRLSRALGSTR